MNYWYRERFHSTLLFCIGRENHGWLLHDDSRNQFSLASECDGREQEVHTYTHTSPHTPQKPSLAAPQLHGSLQERGGAWSPQQVRERWVDFSHFQSTLHRKGHINTSEFKSKWIFWYHLYVTPFHNKEEIHVTSIKVKKKTVVMVVFMKL